MTSTVATPAPGDWRRGLARTGLTAKGVLYLILGVLAHGVWQLVATLTGDPVEGSEVSKRITYAARTVIYLGLGGVAVSVLFQGGGRGGSGGGGTDQATSTLLGLPGGTWIVAGVGVVIIGVGLYEIIRHGRQCEFMERIGRTEHGHVRRNVRRAGRAGHIALGLVSLLVGGFFVVAAVQHDPDKSRGMSEALQTVADHSWGPAALTAVAIGVILYGVFCLAEARYRRAA